MNSFLTKLGNTLAVKDGERLAALVSTKQESSELYKLIHANSQQDWSVRSAVCVLAMFVR